MFERNFINCITKLMNGCTYIILVSIVSNVSIIYL